MQQRHVPQSGDGLGLDALQLHADQLADFAEVPADVSEVEDHLLLAGRDIRRVQVADLEVGKQLLAR